MNVIPTEVLDVYILEPKVFGDHRGWFMETWSTRNMEENNKTEKVIANIES